MSAPASPVPVASRNPNRIFASERAHCEGGVIASTRWLTINRAATRFSLLATTFADKRIF